jgi:kinesin family member C1
LRLQSHRPFPLLARSLFSYGQTGSGKTWTMQGGAEPGSEGLIPRSVAQILATARRLASSAGWSYSLEASFLEIYNEAVRDLLRVPKPGGPPEPASLPIVNAAPAGGAGGASSSSAAADDGSGPNAGVEVPGLTKVPVDDEGAVAALLARAAKRRATASTAMNELSSRSHSVFTLYIKGTHPVKGVALAGTLNLVDLAG